MENLNTKDRVLRTLTGLALITGMLTLAADPVMIFALAFASFYPLMTALMAWDPVYEAMLMAGSKVTRTIAPKEAVSKKI